MERPQPSLPLALLLLVSSASPSVASAAAKQPVTHEALWLMKRVGAPVPSPDGRWVVFSVTEPAYDPKEQTADLWIVPADGSARPRKLTFSKNEESYPTWSPDSRRIAFTRREGEETAQVYILDVAGGGEAARVTNLSTGARSPRFRPDGKAISFASVVYPGALDDEASKKIAKERRERKYNVRTYDSFPIRRWDTWLDESQLHLFVQTLEPEGKARDLLAGTKLVAAAGFGARVNEGGREEMESAWSKDGQSLIFAVTTTRHTVAYAEEATELYRVNASGGEPQRIAAGPGNYRRPSFSADGKTLFALWSPHGPKTYHLDRLVAFDWPAMGNRRILTAAPFDRSVSSYAVLPDGRTVYFTAEEAGLEKIYSVHLRGGAPRLLVNPERGVFSEIALAGRTRGPVMVARWGSSVDPAEVVRIDPATGKRQRLSSFNVESAAALDWQPPRHFFTSSRGKRIHSMLVVPAGFAESKKYPLFVLMHGGPHAMWRDDITLRWNYHLLARPGYVVLLTNYTGSTGFGQRFAQEIAGDPLKGPAQEINEAADEAIKRFSFIDGGRQVAGGASYGGHLANWMQASTTRYRALVSHAGLVNLESQWGTSDTIYHREVMLGGPLWDGGGVWREQSPLRYAAKLKTPILLSSGEKDYRVPLNQALEHWAVLQRLRIPSRLLVWPDENHWIQNGENSRHFYREVAAWISRWLDTPAVAGQEEAPAGPAAQ
jgi:dipeptidyl aminopeptidase/acylaminoacyl peptidase